MASTDRFFDADEDLLQRVAPLKGYEKQDLVSLEDATKPLKHFISGLPTIVRDAKREMVRRETSLSVDEATAIYLYTLRHEKPNESISIQLNRELRSNERHHVKHWLPYLKLFVTTLNKLPAVKTTIWRFSTCDISHRYAVDGIWSGFSSCTEIEFVPDEFIEGSGIRTIFKIDCLNGKRIHDYSQYSDENEVLLMPGTYLRVTEKSVVKGGVTLIGLQEKSSPNLELMLPPGVSLSATVAHPTEHDHHAASTETKSTRSLSLSQPTRRSSVSQTASQHRTDKPWLDLQFHPNNESIMTPEDRKTLLRDPPGKVDKRTLNQVMGSLIGTALGDALGAHCEFRTREHMEANPVRGLEGGGTWDLKKGQFTDATSMMLCLASSLVSRGDFVPYDQLVRYKWWFRHGYMSSTSRCFDIGTATSQSLLNFEHRQRQFADELGISLEEADFLSDADLIRQFAVRCSEDGVASNGALMRLAPVPLFFYRNPHYAVEFSGVSGVITHGDRKAYDACRYYGALIVAVLHGESKDNLLNNDFYLKHESWFSGRSLTQEVMDVVRGSYKRRGGYDEGIRGKRYIVNAMEAALWAFWSDKGSFEQGALNAVNLGDETGTTAAIYGQLAGAYYGYEHLPKKWAKHVYGHPFITCLSKWIVYEGESWRPTFQVLHTPGSDLRRHSSFYKDLSSWPSNQSTTVVPTSISSRRLSVTKLLGREEGRSLELYPAYRAAPEASAHTHRRLSVAAAPLNISSGTGHFYGGARASYSDDPDPTYDTRHRARSLAYYEKPH